MAGIDPREERKRLAKFYAALSDEELYELLRDADSLTEVAWEALEEEADRRGLDEDRLPIPEVKSEFAPMVNIHTFRDLPDALLAKGKLECYGIECYLANENVVRMDWFWSNAMGGIKLQVREEDFQAAATILAQPAPATMSYREDAEEYHQPRCPVCNSSDVIFESLNKPLTFGLLVLAGVPIPIRRNRWRCNACQVEWREE